MFKYCLSVYDPLIDTDVKGLKQNVAILKYILTADFCTQCVIMTLTGWGRGEVGVLLLMTSRYSSSMQVKYYYPYS